MSHNSANCEGVFLQLSGGEGNGGGGGWAFCARAILYKVPGTMITTLHLIYIYLIKIKHG